MFACCMQEEVEGTAEISVKPTVAVVDHVEKKLEAAPEVGVFTVLVPCKAF